MQGIHVCGSPEPGLLNPATLITKIDSLWGVAPRLCGRNRIVSTKPPLPAGSW